VDVKLVQARTEEFSKKLSALNEQAQKGFRELQFRQNFAVFIMLIFAGLGIVIFLWTRNTR
jgi:hypothetical protein